MPKCLCGIVRSAKEKQKIESVKSFPLSSPPPCSSCLPAWLPHFLLFLHVSITEANTNKEQTETSKHTEVIDGHWGHPMTVWFWLFCETIVETKTTQDTPHFHQTCEMHLRIVRRVEKERSSDEINQGPCGRGLTTKSELYNKSSRTYKMMCNDYNDYIDMRPKNVKIQQSPQRSRESELSRHWPLSVFSMSQSKCDNAPTLRYNTMQQCDNNSTISGSFFPTGLDPTH